MELFVSDVGIVWGETHTLYKIIALLVGLVVVLALDDEEDKQKHGDDRENRERNEGEY